MDMWHAFKVTIILNSEDKHSLKKLWVGMAEIK